MKFIGHKDEEIPLTVETDSKKQSVVLNILKHIWARVYLNIYGGDFTQDSELTLKAALMEFFLPTTKRKLSKYHWLGAGKDRDISSFLGASKAALIILIDFALFFPRLAINIAKVFTEVLPDMVAQLFLLAGKKLEKKYEDANGLSAVGYGLVWFATGFFAGLFKSIYFIGCCTTSPIATSIRARTFSYPNKTLSSMSWVFSHITTPMISMVCYFAILFLLANFIPGLGVVIGLAGAAGAGIIVAYIAIDHLLSWLNRNPNGDDLIESGLSLEDAVRYSDRDMSVNKACEVLKGRGKTREEIEECYPHVEAEIKQTLRYDNPHKYERVLTSTLKENVGETTEYYQPPDIVFPENTNNH